MKKKYIAPCIEVAACILNGFIAASLGRGGDATQGEDPTQSVEATDEIDDLRAKQFGAWSSWDD